VFQGFSYSRVSTVQKQNNMGQAMDTMFMEVHFYVGGGRPVLMKMPNDHLRPMVLSHPNAKGIEGSIRSLPGVRSIGPGVDRVDSDSGFGVTVRMYKVTLADLETVSTILPKLRELDGWELVDDSDTHKVGGYRPFVWKTNEVHILDLYYGAMYNPNTGDPLVVDIGNARHAGRAQFTIPSIKLHELKNKSGEMNGFVRLYAYTGDKSDKVTDAISKGRKQES
jgi:hypothetical protein